MATRGHELSGWKEIAAHLGVNVRTAQKYERERQLPVQRLPGGRGRVAAHGPTLDAWKSAPNGEEGIGSVCYRWPLAEGMIAELRFIGAAPSAVHLDLFTQYLNLVKTAFRGQSQQ